jgi:F-type H+-transporting ATPase subunit b
MKLRRLRRTVSIALSVAAATFALHTSAIAAPPPGAAAGNPVPPGANAGATPAPNAAPNPNAPPPGPNPSRRQPRPPPQRPAADVAPPAPTSPAEPAEAEHEEEGPKPVNWADFSNKDQPPYLAALINFAILAFIYVYFGRKPIAAALKARREEVSKQIEEAQKIKHEAEARSKQYSAKLDDLGTELATTKATLAAAGAGEKARIVREAEEKAERMQKDALFLLEQERKQVRLDIQREAVEAAVVAAGDLLRTKLTMADQERVAEEFLTTLVPAKTVVAGSSTGGVS